MPAGRPDRPGRGTVDDGLIPVSRLQWPFRSRVRRLSWGSRIHGRRHETDMAGPGGLHGAGTGERRRRRGHGDGATSRAVTAAERLPDGDGPPGFWWGTDSCPVPVPGSAPYNMPHLGGAYGGYIGMTGSWSNWLAARAVSSPTPRPTARRRTPTTSPTTGASATRCTGSWAGPASTRTGTARPRRRTPGAGSKRRGRWLTSATGTSTTRSSGWTSRCPASRPPPTTAGTLCTPPRAAAWLSGATCRPALTGPT